MGQDISSDPRYGMRYTTDSWGTRLSNTLPPASSPAEESAIWRANSRWQLRAYRDELGPSYAGSDDDEEHEDLEAMIVDDESSGDETVTSLRGSKRQKSAKGVPDTSQDEALARLLQQEELKEVDEGERDNLRKKLRRKNPDCDEELIESVVEAANELNYLQIPIEDVKMIHAQIDILDNDILSHGLGPKYLRDLVKDRKRLLKLGVTPGWLDTLPTSISDRIRILKVWIHDTAEYRLRYITPEQPLHMSKRLIVVNTDDTDDDQALKLQRLSKMSLKAPNDRSHEGRSEQEALELDAQLEVIEGEELQGYPDVESMPAFSSERSDASVETVKPSQYDGAKDRTPLKEMNEAEWLKRRPSAENLRDKYNAKRQSNAMQDTSKGDTSRDKTTPEKDSNMESTKHEDMHEASGDADDKENRAPTDVEMDTMTQGIPNAQDASEVSDAQAHQTQVAEQVSEDPVAGPTPGSNDDNISHPVSGQTGTKRDTRVLSNGVHPEGDERSQARRRGSTASDLPSRGRPEISPITLMGGPIRSRRRHHHRRHTDWVRLRRSPRLLNSTPITAPELTDSVPNGEIIHNFSEPRQNPIDLNAVNAAITQAVSAARADPTQESNEGDDNSQAPDGTQSRSLGNDEDTTMCNGIPYDPERTFDESGGEERG